uniref:Uncharacterized protein n=1 Tax=Phlebotomus papatasi TaxID=29031 RepID=A0A1B0D7K6_PHLPP
MTPFVDCNIVKEEYCVQEDTVTFQITEEPDFSTLKYEAASDLADTLKYDDHEKIKSENMWQVDETQYNKLDPLAEHNSSCRIMDVEVFSPKNGNDTKTKTSGRKKKGDPEKWAQNIRVKSREKGLPYINRAGKLIPQKSKKEPCYTKCRRRCTSIFSEEERDVIFQKFWNLI